MNRENRKHHVLTNKFVTADMIEPPIFVAVVGPPNVRPTLAGIIAVFTPTTKFNTK